MMPLLRCRHRPTLPFAADAAGTHVPLPHADSMPLPLAAAEDGAPFAADAAQGQSSRFVVGWTPQHL